jgi:phospholipid transport system substrate-binding protein
MSPLNHSLRNRAKRLRKIAAISPGSDLSNRLVRIADEWENNLSDEVTVSYVCTEVLAADGACSGIDGGMADKDLTGFPGSQVMNQTLQKFPRWLKLPVLGIALICCAVAPLRHAAAAQDAAAFVTSIGTQGIQALGPEVPASQRLTRFRQLLQEDFDLAGIGLFALGKYRLSATPQEQQEFFRLYPDFTVRAFSNRLSEYGGASFRVTNRRQFGAETLVNSEVTRVDGSRVQFDWYLTEVGGGYRITDVVVAGVSMKVALRDQFAAWIQNNGGRTAALLAVLRQQTAQTR